MSERLTHDTLNRPVYEQMRTDFIQLQQDLTVSEALDLILEKQPAGRIVYFYVVDSDYRLSGVIPTRRLLLSPRETRLSKIMIEPVIAIPRQATVFDACEFFILYRLLAFPVVDEKRRIIGIVDLELYTQEMSNVDRRESHNDLFQLIGVQLLESQQRSLPNLFRQRFPWLLVTLVGGLLTAIISDAYYHVASLPLVVPFIPLVLALASSVTAQSVSLALEAIRGHTPDWPTLLSKVKREFTTGALLGVACALIAGMLAFSWKADPTPVFVLVGSIVTSVTCAAVLGLVMPYLFRWLNRGSQVAAGPIALASADVVSLLVYFNFARWFLS